MKVSGQTCPIVIDFTLFHLEVVDAPLKGEYFVFTVEYLVFVLPADLSRRLVVIEFKVSIFLLQFPHFDVQARNGFLSQNQLLFVERSCRSARISSKQRIDPLFEDGVNFDKTGHSIFQGPNLAFVELYFIIVGLLLFHENYFVLWVDSGILPFCFYLKPSTVLPQFLQLILQQFYLLFVTFARRVSLEALAPIFDIAAKTSTALFVYVKFLIPYDHFI